MILTGTKIKGATQVEDAIGFNLYLNKPKHKYVDETDLWDKIFELNSYKDYNASFWTDLSKLVNNSFPVYASLLRYKLIS